MSWRDFAIDLQGIDSRRLLGCWNWLFQGETITPLAMTSFGDWILLRRDGNVHFLDLASGEIFPIAPGAAEFERRAALQENLEGWFISELVLQLRERGVLLKPGECYGYKFPPIIGGKLEFDNIEPTPHMVHQAIQAQLIEQTWYLSPGTQFTGFDLNWK